MRGKKVLHHISTKKERGKDIKKEDRPIGKEKRVAGNRKKRGVGQEFQVEGQRGMP